MNQSSSLRIDLNCDLGEWDAENQNPDQQLRDRSIMPLVSSVNIACGGHRGDADSLRFTMEQAAILGVAIGLHPSFPDRDGFGRVEYPWSEDLVDELRRQLDLGRQVAQELGLTIHHIKPHGALYNMAARDLEWAERLWVLWHSWDNQVLVYGLSGSEVSKGLGIDLRYVHRGDGSLEFGGSVDFRFNMRPSYRAEAFADRTYEPDLSLCSRSLDGAVISDMDALQAQVKDLVLNRKVLCTDGVYRELDVDTICLHSDTPDSVKLAHLMAAKLYEWDVEVCPC
ncbi:MAG: hypothetical protein CL672_01285 [Balneola sp.]|nr:hypothetical protein [Balneola sp.]|tara:strand:+ start:2427 stop:3275 length:849 start_codon:yes stop_codon:yes gene_type:complete